MLNRLDGVLLRPVDMPGGNFGVLTEQGAAAESAFCRRREIQRNMPGMFAAK